MSSKIRDKVYKEIDPDRGMRNIGIMWGTITLLLAIPVVYGHFAPGTGIIAKFLHEKGYQNVEVRNYNWGNNCFKGITTYAYSFTGDGKSGWVCQDWLGNRVIKYPVLKKESK